MAGLYPQPFRSCNPRPVPWKGKAVEKLATAMYKNIPQKALQSLRRQKMRIEGPLIALKADKEAKERGVEANRICALDLESNAVWILPVLRVGAKSLPRSRYYMADVFLAVNDMARGCLLDGPADALRNALRMRYCLAYLRKLRRNSSVSKGSRLITEMKDLLDADGASGSADSELSDGEPTGVWGRLKPFVLRSRSDLRALKQSCGLLLLAYSQESFH